MKSKKTARQKAIIKRNIFLSLCSVIMVLVIILIVFIVNSVFKTNKGNDSSDIIPEASSSDISSEQDSSNEASSEEVSSKPNPEYVTRGSYTLDASYSNLLLVNAENPLPEDYDYTGNLTEINQKYINGSLRQIDKNVYPYMQAMIEAAWADGVKLYVWSPYRSYDTQNMLFQKQVQRCINNGTPQSEAEAEAATVVARPGTSEHHTGLAADFNMASDDFENTAMYEWMQKHAAEYGFIMRYPADKTDITGVIYESWHYRFVGINAAKEMNSLGMCLEEYVKYKNKR